VAIVPCNKASKEGLEVVLASSQEKVFCISIDLDDMRFYRRIHGLSEEGDTPLVFQKAMPRFLDFCDRLGVKATVFVISEDFKWREAKDVLRMCIESGHEIGSHSRSHKYDLSRQSKEVMQREVLGSKVEIEDTLGTEVLGFRGPGYNLSEQLLKEIADAGYEYDSTILPSLSYYIARALIIGFMRVRGKQSASITGRFCDFARGCKPFRWGDGVIELPISSFILPFIGTTLSRRSFARLAKTLFAGKRFLHLVFHALDFLEASEAGTDLLIEPALRVRLDERLDLFSMAIKGLMARRKMVRLRDVVKMNMV
jgi:hypothetical protein